MLKQRLIFGTIMTLLFVAIVIFDGALDGSLTRSNADDASIGASIFTVLILILILLAQKELSLMAAAGKITIFTPVAAIATALIATVNYWTQFLQVPVQTTVLLILTATLMAAFLYQKLKFGTAKTITNCSATIFSVIYLGVLSSFILAIRLRFGIWHLLMFVFVIKCSDIGAYFVGKYFGRHKFSPNISPGKTWEGIAGAMIFAAIIAILFAAIFDIMSLPLAILFGVSFAFIGQLGDLVESMIKRDVEQKDSAQKVPGFGGVLDIVDSLLPAASLAYLFFYWL